MPQLEREQVAVPVGIEAAGGSLEPDHRLTLGDADVEDAVVREPRLALADGALPVDDGFHAAQVHAVQPESEIRTVILHPVLDVVRGDELPLEAVGDDGLDAVARHLVTVFRGNAVAHQREEHAGDDGQGGDQEADGGFHRRLSIRSVMGAMNRSMLPAPKVTSTSVGSCSR